MLLKKKPSNFIELKPNRCLYNSIIYETIIREKFQICRIIFFICIVNYVFMIKKEYKDKKGLRHAFTENLKDFRRKCKKQLQNKMQMMT